MTDLQEQENDDLAGALSDGIASEMEQEDSFLEAALESPGVDQGIAYYDWEIGKLIDAAINCGHDDDLEKITLYLQAVFQMGAYVGRSMTQTANLLHRESSDHDSTL